MSYIIYVLFQYQSPSRGSSASQGMCLLVRWQKHLTFINILSLPFDPLKLFASKHLSGAYHVPDTVLSIFHMLIYLLKQFCEAGTTVQAILQMRKLRSREDQSAARGAGDGQEPGCELECLGSTVRVLEHLLHYEVAWHEWRPMTPTCIYSLVAKAG